MRFFKHGVQYQTSANEHYQYIQLLRRSGGQLVRDNKRESCEIGKNGQNDHLRSEQKDHPLTGAN